MQDEGIFGCKRPHITWEDKNEKLGEKLGRTMVEMKRKSKDRFDWQR